MPPVLEDRDLIRNLPQFAHPVGHIQDNLPFVFQLADDLKEAVDLRVRKGGGRLVKCDDSQVLPAVCLHDLHHLLVRDGQILDLLGRPDRKSELIDDTLRHPVRLRSVDHAQTVGGHPAKVDVFRHTQLQQNLPLLIDNADTILNRLMRGLIMLLLPIQKVGPARRLVVTVERLQQRRLTGSVFPQKCEDLASERLEADIIQSLDAREVFRNMLKLKNSSHFASSCC